MKILLSLLFIIFIAIHLPGAHPINQPKIRLVAKMGVGVVAGGHPTQVPRGGVAHPIRLPRSMSLAGETQIMEGVGEVGIRVPNQGGGGETHKLKVPMKMLVVVVVVVVVEDGVVVVVVVDGVVVAVEVGDGGESLKQIIMQIVIFFYC